VKSITGVKIIEYVKCSALREYRYRYLHILPCVAEIDGGISFTLSGLSLDYLKYKYSRNVHYCAKDIMKGNWFKVSNY
jgi:hypothetical protein